MNLCRYKNIFGEPGKGAHSIRVFNIAVVDVVATVILAYIVHKLFNVNFVVTLIICFILGIISHHLFCVRSTIDKLIFG